MERNEGIIRWSPNASRDEFMVLNLNHRIIQLYGAKGNAQAGSFDYQRLSKHNDFPPLNTYDWSPAIRGLVALGTSHGEVNLLRSVAFNTTGLLAIGLDRIRNDSCLKVWDVNERLADWDVKKPGWGVGKENKEAEPMKKLEGSVAVTSVRFFEDSPQTLVIGIKNQSVRIHDLRDPNSAVINFQTRCNNNLAIDYDDCNYFASSSLDQPGLVVWDRRVSGRSSASPMYLESFDQEEIPWGATLKLDRAIDVERTVHIKQLRYCREHRGTLGVLSSAGQLQVIKTNKEYIEPGSVDDIRGSPKLLEVEKSFSLEHPYFDPDHKQRPEDRIISFDWVNVGTPDLDPRVIALRANGKFEILQLPSATAGHLSQLLPWSTHRDGLPSTALLNFKDPTEQEATVGPLFAAAAKVNAPVFGPDEFSSAEAIRKLTTTIKKAVHSKDNPVIDLLAPANPAMPQSSEDFGEKLSKLSIQSKTDKDKPGNNELPETSSGRRVRSSRKFRDRSHYYTSGTAPETKIKGELIDTTMLRRALDGYLFDCEKNWELVAGDQWLQEVWEWIADAANSAKDDGMVSGSLDLSYTGVYTVWMNLLGENPKSRLIDGSIIPDGSQWERLIAGINKQAGRREFEGPSTEKPHHRQLCLSMCGMVRSATQLEEDLNDLVKQEKYTRAAALALFEGLLTRAVDILKIGGTELLFVAMALDIKLKSNNVSDLGTTEWTKALDSHPQMAHDPYLRAIYGFITSGDWSSIADETSLPLRSRAGVALRKFDDAKLTDWLTKQMEQAVSTGDIEGIVLAGITENMVDILAKYIEKFMDYQTPILIMSFCYPRYISDVRCGAWRKNYQNLLQRNKKFILRVKFEQQSTAKSRLRNGKSVITAPPRQVTIRCLNCDAQSAHDLSNSAAAPSSAPGPSSTTVDTRNPLTSSGYNTGLCCPKCGSHLSRCAVCMEVVGVPRSDRPELSNDPAISRMANFPTFCLKCKHVMHMDHSVAWFSRHVECPVPECRCQCNESTHRQN
ncbi:SEH-associated protein 4 [Lachnellula cervina]|uniref:SEH-associated protein 4 n=1 Tax=Lachnellula cervina TaxID=1316786 RepID=A0A7D8YPB1_9HELO|nr:SEH-associated protein 4 [Lachnellula cervina]